MGPEDLHLLTSIFSPLTGPTSVIVNKVSLKKRDLGVWACTCMCVRMCVLLAVTSRAQTGLEQEGI